MEANLRTLFSEPLLFSSEQNDYAQHLQAW